MIFADSQAYFCKECQERSDGHNSMNRGYESYEQDESKKSIMK
jgi:hypothetical protein